MISFIFSFKPWARLTIGVLFMATVAVLSLLPSYDLPSISRYIIVHRIAHLCMYLGLGFLACWNLKLNPERMKLVYLLLAGIFMYGVLMEILQRSMHNGRSFRFSDMIVNLIGAISGILIYRYLSQKQTEAGQAI
jgi:VanZ family protein